MAQFKAFSDDSQTLGQSLITWIAASGAFEKRMLQMMKEEGLTEIRPDAWYPMQAILNTCKKIYDSVGPNTLFLIGKNIPEHAVFPPSINSLGKALGAINTAYRMNNKGTDIGFYKLQRTGDQSALMVCENPFPCDFDRGIISAMTDKFKPKGCFHKASVTHDKGSCRNKGNKSCTYVISW